MTRPVSKSATNRLSGKHQIDEQRAHILDSARELFLQNGLENTSMMDIAKQAGITRVTLYRYFANRDEIAVEIQVRMMKRIEAVFPPVPGEEHLLETQRRRAQLIIRNFEGLKDAFRYIGMFDKIYLDQAAGSALAAWTKAQLGGGQEHERPGVFSAELAVILSTVTWFLEKLALRDELTWSDPAIPLEEHLKFFEEMIMHSFDLLHDPEEAGLHHPYPANSPESTVKGNQKETENVK